MRAALLDLGLMIVVLVGAALGSAEAGAARGAHSHLSGGGASWIVAGGAIWLAARFRVDRGGVSVVTGLLCGAGTLAMVLL